MIEALPVPHLSTPSPECARKLAKNRRCKSPTGKV